MYEVIGVEFREYTNKSGKLVQGYNLYMTYFKQDIEGVACETVWVNPDTMAKARPSVGDHIEIYYNKYGRVQAISIA